MRRTDQAVHVHNPKLDLIAHRFAQARLARSPGRRLRRFRQVVEKSITRHQSLLRAKRSLDGITMPSTTQHKSFNMPKDSQALSLSKHELEAKVRTQPLSRRRPPHSLRDVRASAAEGPRRRERSNGRDAGCGSAY